MSEYLFARGDLSQYLRQKEQAMEQEIVLFPRDYILNASEEDLVTHLIDKYSLDAPSVKCEDKEIIETRPTQLPRTSTWGDGRTYDAHGQLIVLAVPFAGDPELFQFKPSTFRMKGVRADVYDGELKIAYEEIDNNKDQLTRDINSDMETLNSNVSYVQRDVAAYNEQLPVRVRRAVVDRKNVLLQQLSLVKELNIPVRRREGATQTYAIPTVKRKTRIERPVVSGGAYEPEPVLAMEEYEHILSVAHHMSVMLEQSPATFAKLKEEEIRDHFLLQLNGQYEGQATGETFNQGGKTDIIIKSNGRNVFIAECKFWTGPDAFPECIDQLLRYTCWRDTKTAIFLFNKNKDTSKVLDQIPGLVKGHANFKREHPGRLDETRFRYMLHQPGDANREFLLTICVYDIPSSKK